MQCRRKILWFVYLFHRYTSRSEYKYCSNVSVVFSGPKDTDNNDSKEGKEERSTLYEKDDVLESFTNTLLQKSAQKWRSQIVKMRQEKYMYTQTAEKQTDPVEEKKSTIVATRVENKPRRKQISSAVVKNYFTECQRTKGLPGTHTTSFLLQSCAQLGDKETIVFAKSVIKLLDPMEYSRQSGYDHFVAEALWKNENFEDSLTLFWNVYKDNIHLQTGIKSVLKCLIADGISSKSEAVLVLITNFSVKFVDTYCDYTLLSCVWEYCFVSEWHSDNQFAASLLEQYPEMKNNIGLKVHHIASRTLKSNKLDILQRLFEVLLKYEMKTQYQLVLRSLFDYACSVRDLRACSAIIQSTYDLDVTLTEEQSAVFLQLFCSEDTPSHVIKLPIKTWSTKPSKFIFKF